jgi:hypothetical protein
MAPGSGSEGVRESTAGPKSGRGSSRWITLTTAGSAGGSTSTSIDELPRQPRALSVPPGDAAPRAARSAARSHATGSPRASLAFTAVTQPPQEAEPGVTALAAAIHSAEVKWTKGGGCTPSRMAQANLCLGVWQQQLVQQ